MSFKNLHTTAKAVMACAEKHGATAARVRVGSSRTFRLKTKNEQTELLKESRSMSFGVRIFCGKRSGSFFSSDLTAQAVERFVQKAVEMVKLTDPDPASGLPPKEAIAPLARIDLQLCDPVLVSSQKEKALPLCRTISEAARSRAKDAVNIEAAFTESHGLSVLHTTDGFQGEREATSLNLSCGTYVPDRDGKKQSGFDSGRWRHFADAAAIEQIGYTAAERANAMKGARPLKTGSYPIVIVNYWGDYFTGLLLRSLSGAAIYRNMSCLGDKLHKAIAGPHLTLIDDPFVPRGLASRLFDGESMVAHKRPIVEKGVLKNFYFDSYWARKQKVAPTTGGHSNLLFTPGTRNGTAMLADLERALFITNFLGGNYNPLSGDFSAGIRGFLYEKGARIKPIAEMNLAGNLLEVLPKLEEVGNDPYPYMSIYSPAMRFAPLVVAGV